MMPMIKATNTSQAYRAMTIVNRSSPTRSAEIAMPHHTMYKFPVCFPRSFCTIHRIQAVANPNTNLLQIQAKKPARKLIKIRAASANTAYNKISLTLFFICLYIFLIYLKNIFIDFIKSTIFYIYCIVYWLCI